MLYTKSVIERLLLPPIVLVRRAELRAVVNMAVVKICLLLLALTSISMAYTGYDGSLSEPVYTLQTMINVSPSNADNRTSIQSEIGIVFNADETHYEWENYDGWFNNPAHPDWGGAGKCCVVGLRTIFCRQRPPHTTVYAY